MYRFLSSPFLPTCVVTLRGDGAPVPRARMENVRGDWAMTCEGAMCVLILQGGGVLGWRMCGVTGP